MSELYEGFERPMLSGLNFVHNYLKKFDALKSLMLLIESMLDRDLLINPPYSVN